MTPIQVQVTPQERPCQNTIPTPAPKDSYTFIYATGI